MLRTFLHHQFIAFTRSRNRAGNILGQLVLGLFILYILILAMIAGFYMGKIIPEFFPGKNMIEVFIGFIIYYFLVDFLGRIQMQGLPTLSIVPYFHLNISRRKIISFLNIRGLFSFFNLIPLLIFLPFISAEISKTYGVIVAGMMVVVILSLTVFNNYLALYVKRKSISSALFLLIGFSIIAVLGALDYFKIISLATFANAVFKLILHVPWLGFGFTLAALTIIIINSRYLRKNLYIEELSTKAKSKTSTTYPFLDRFGKVGELCALELKLILRHKRSRTAFLMGFLFLLYGFIFFRSELMEKNEFGTMLLAAILMTGFSITNYGQFIFAWQSSHFDGLLANKIDFTDFIKAKFLLFTIASTVISLLSTLYIFISWKILLFIIAVYLYNIGFGIVIVLWFGTKNYKRLDTSQSANFNWQGISALQFLIGIFLMLVPFAIYWPFSWVGKPYWGLISLCLFGLITLLMRNFWVDQLTRIFRKQKYKMAEGFRD